MISQTVNGLERKVYFRPGWHKVNSDPKKDYGVHGMEIHFILKGDKGAVHFLQSTGMMLEKTYDWWDATGRAIQRMKLHMGIDVGYHSPKKMYEGQEVVWPTKMRKTGEGLLDVEFDKIGDAPPVCEHIGVPCYSDGSALRAHEWEQIFLEKGDEVIWSMLEAEYRERFEV